MKSFALLAAAVLFGSALAEQKKIGCYSSVPASAQFNNVTDGNSMGKCGNDYCKLSTAFAMANRTLCYCVDEVPQGSDKVDANKCNLSCPGFPADNCGGIDIWQFYDNGIALTIPTASPVSSSTTTLQSSTVTSPPSTTKAPAQSSTSTASGKPSSTGEPSSKPNTAGIAAGVVIGVVVIAGALGGLWFFMKQRKKRALEEEHRRNAEVNAFTKPSHNPFNDTRLDPAVLAQRRMSDGSIADNHDYSRRILKVTNA